MLRVGAGRAHGADASNRRAASPSARPVGRWAASARPDGRRPDSRKGGRPDGRRPDSRKGGRTAEKSGGQPRRRARPASGA
ncbi:hypothetical protein OEM_40870 [Mycobacterium intracellulare subsp. yongonense 05-1390]|nr:hypothetical protein OEM_40870 [Mycobacterium intracellulare subsp. yongonense 05-1390]